MIRSPKSGSDWNLNELQAYNITVSTESPDIFYGMPLPTTESLSSLDAHIVSGTLNTQGLSDETYRLMQYMDLASKPSAGQDSAILEFTKEFLRVLGFENLKSGHLLQPRYPIQLQICNKIKRAQTFPSFRASRPCFLWSKMITPSSLIATQRRKSSLRPSRLFS